MDWVNCLIGQCCCDFMEVHQHGSYSQTSFASEKNICNFNKSLVKQQKYSSGEFSRHLNAYWPQHGIQSVKIQIPSSTLLWCTLLEKQGFSPTLVIVKHYLGLAELVWQPKKKSLFKGNTYLLELSLSLWQKATGQFHLRPSGSSWRSHYINKSTEIKK